MKKQEVANHVFARNPKLKELFVTSDKRGFYKECDADAHAQNLKSREVVCVKNAKAKGKAAPVADAPKEVSLSKLTKPQLLEVAEGLDVTEDNTKAEIIAAIEKAKTADIDVVDPAIVGEQE